MTASAARVVKASLLPRDVSTDRIESLGTYSLADSRRILEACKTGFTAHMNMLAKALMNTLRNIHEVAWSCLVNEQLTENACEHKKMTVQMKGMQKKPCTFPAEHGTPIQSNQMCVEVAEVI